MTKRVVSGSESSEVITRSSSYLAGSGSNTSPLVSSLTANHGSTNLFSGNYSYDSVGNITAITGSTPASYTYDSQNQLLTEVRGGTTYTYTYDAAGNLLSKTKLSGSGTDTFTYGNAEWRDLLTAYNGNAITYDTVGNPTTWYDGAAMTWVNGRRLASISATNSHSALAFTYDVDGLRLTKTVGTGSSAVEHKYTWHGGKLIAEYDGTNTLEFFYDESGAPYAFSCNGTTYYYVTNLQGDVVKIVNASGTSQAEYSYNAWGQVISATGTLAAINPIRYRGYYYDKESGLYYLKSRYYDPQICRFINADGMASTGQGIVGCNMFAYCGNNPVSRIDCGGHVWETAFDIVTLGFSIAEVVAAPADPWAWIGLAGDVVDLIPFVTGVGESAKALGATFKYGDDVLDLAKDAKHAFEEGTGVYEILFKSGKNYVGKGGFQRMINSGRRLVKENGDDIVAMMWKSAKDSREAFIGEYLLQIRRSVLSSLKDAETYNKIWSPGKKFFSEIFK